MPTSLKVETAVETWPIAGEFVIARGAKRETQVVVASVSDGAAVGRGECVPYSRYGETPESVCTQIQRQASVSGRVTLLGQMPAGAARNALDCALWHLEAQRAGTSVAALAGLPRPHPVITAYTISLDDPGTMAARAAQAAQGMPLLKIKLGGQGDIDRMRQIRRACPETRLIGDANEAWTPSMLADLMAAAAETGFELIEQPLPAGEDAGLAYIDRPVPVCADESLHTRADLSRVRECYDVVNIKLDKAGGLTEALALSRQARAAGFKVMVGCMVATSLAIAPAILLAQEADWVDLDGPLLLKRDRQPPVRYDGALLHPAPPELWG